MEDKLLTPDEVADILRLKTRTIKGWLREGKLRGVKFGKEWRIRETALREFVEQAEEKPKSEKKKERGGPQPSKIELQPLLQQKESEHLEFKEAKQNFDFQKLLTYCVALANEGGGMLVLGVSDKKPRTVVGTKAFEDLQKTRENIYQRIQLRVEVVEKWEEGKRILIFKAPSRSPGVPLDLDGRYLMRVGECLQPMKSAQLKEIFKEVDGDFSAQICREAQLSDIDARALALFRKLWARTSQNPEYLTMPVAELLKSADLLSDQSLNYASLILLGTKEALGRFLANAEVIFEYRHHQHNVEYQDRKEFRKAFLLYFDELWNTIDLRNEVNHLQEKFIRREIKNFEEEVVREAILNAVCHRDYRLQGSIFIKQYPQKICFESPGGLPFGVTPENICFVQIAPNRRIAEIFQKLGFVERSGQGADKMFRKNILQGKGKPDYSRSDEYNVRLVLPGPVQDAQFIKFLEKVSQEKEISYSMEDLLLLDEIRQGKKPISTAHLKRLKDLGVIESIGRGRGLKYLLSQRYYHFTKNPAGYTKRKGLDKETQKALILKHLSYHGKGTVQEFGEVLPQLTLRQVRNLLNELKRENQIEFTGSKRSGHWIMV